MGNKYSKKKGNIYSNEMMGIEKLLVGLTTHQIMKI
jgi:hypothetical protein